MRIVVLIGVVAIVLCGAATGSAGGGSQVSDVAQMQQAMLTFAGGPEALAGVKTLVFDFRVQDGNGEGLVFHHAYDREQGLYRYECSCADFAKVPVWHETAGDRWQPAPNPPQGDSLVAVYRFPTLEGTVYVDGKPLPEPENSRILRRVHSRVMNERAWMFLPFFLSSPRLKARPVEPIAGSDGGRLYGFEGFWGEKPGDSDVWTVYLGPDGELVRSDFRLKHDLEKSSSVLWRDWEWHGPVRIARERVFSESGRQLLFDRIEVNKGVRLAEGTARLEGAKASGEARLGVTEVDTAAGSEVLFDFSDAKTAREWQIVNDTVMGGVSRSQFAITTAGTGVFQGTVSLERSGGFASVRSRGRRHDLSSHAGLEIRVRGDGKRYTFSLATDSGFDAVMWQAGFETDEDAWRVVRLPFSDFVPTYRGRTLSGIPPLDSGRIASLGFLIADRQAGPFRLEIDWVRAYGG